MMRKHLPILLLATLATLAVVTFPAQMSVTHAASAAETSTSSETTGACGPGLPSWATISDCPASGSTDNNHPDPQPTTAPSPEPTHEPTQPSPTVPSESTGDSTNTDGSPSDDPCADYSGTQSTACSTVTSVTTLTGRIIEILENPSGGTVVCSFTDTLAGACGSGLTASQASVYGFMFFIGLVVAVAALALLTARAADGKNVNGLALLRGSGTQFVWFFPGLGIAPLLVSALAGVMNNLGSGLMKQGDLSLLSAVVTGLSNPVTLVATIATGGLIVILMGVMTLIAQVLLWLIVEIASMITFIVLCALPVTIALSLYPKFRGAAMKTIGTLAGLILIKPVVGLTLWMMTAVMGRKAVDDPLGLMLLGLIVSALLVCMPLLSTYLLNHIMPSMADSAMSQFTSAGSSVLRTTSNLGRSGLNAAKNLTTKTSSTTSGARPPVSGGTSTLAAPPAGATSGVAPAGSSMGGGAAPAASSAATAGGSATAGGTSAAAGASGAGLTAAAGPAAAVVAGAMVAKTVAGKVVDTAKQQMATTGAPPASTPSTGQSNPLTPRQPTMPESTDRPDGT